MFCLQGDSSRCVLYIHIKPETHLHWWTLKIPRCPSQRVGELSSASWTNYKFLPKWPEVLRRAWQTCLWKTLAKNVSQPTARGSGSRRSSSRSQSSAISIDKATEGVYKIADIFIVVVVVVGNIESDAVSRTTWFESLSFHYHMENDISCCNNVITRLVTSCATLFCWVQRDVLLLNYF